MHLGRQGTVLLFPDGGLAMPSAQHYAKNREYYLAYERDRVKSRAALGAEITALQARVARLEQDLDEANSISGTILRYRKIIGPMIGDADAA